MNPAERRLQRLLLGYADDCEMDKNGRVLIATPLRQHAGLNKKLMLVGQLNKFEIWDEENLAATSGGRYCRKSRQATLH